MPSSPCDEAPASSHDKEKLRHFLVTKLLLCNMIERSSCFSDLVRTQVLSQFSEAGASRVVRCQGGPWKRVKLEDRVFSMALLPETCPDCGQAVDYYVGEHNNCGSLVWHSSLTCLHCGCGLEADDHGKPPEEVRNAILAQDGEWALNVEIADAEKVKLAYVLRSHLNLEIKEALQILKNHPGTILTGTKTEMECLQTLLERSGFNASVSPVAKGS